MENNTLYQVRSIKNLKDMVEQSSKLFGNLNAFLRKDREGNFQGITYSEFKSDIDALGTSLTNLGLKGKFIGVLGENRYEWCVTYLAAVNGVGVIVPLDKELSLSEIVDLLQRSQTTAVVCSSKYAKEIKGISKSCESLDYIIDMDLEQHEDGILSFQELVRQGNTLLENGEKDYLTAEIDEDGMSALLYTSGTTGSAKGVMLSHRNICTVITSVCKTVHLDTRDTSLSILPLHHTYECTLGFLTLIYNGCTIAFSEGLRYITKNFREVCPTVLIAVPLILENMYKKVWEQAGKKKLGRFTLKTALMISNTLYRFVGVNIKRKLFREIHDNLGGNIRLIITGAAAIEPSVSKWFRDIGIQVLQGYGLTECAPLVAGNRDNAYVDSAAGLPIPGVEIEIYEPNENGIGEIIVKGDNVMLGYYQDGDATRKSIRDGWFFTGDMGYLDEDGFLYITGRSKNVIVSKNGKKVFPEEVESYINKSPLVNESMVWGNYDEKTGETLVSAQIFPNIDAIKEKLKKVSVTKEELIKVIDDVIKSVNKNMPIYKRIRHFTIRESEFIKTTTKKIKRHIVKMR